MLQSTTKEKLDARCVVGFVVSSGVRRETEISVVSTCGERDPSGTLTMGKL